ncbi:MAG: hypothetical protein L3K26_18590 [Candidatus Hydrogenedentes bacterium]|nr:hypothetical protein [Candidatus Hydrogenedentota bacterium]
MSRAAGLVALLSLLVQAPLLAASFYVSNAGSDGNDGLSESPLAEYRRCERQHRCGRLPVSNLALAVMLMLGLCVYRRKPRVAE